MQLIFGTSNKHKISVNPLYSSLSTSTITLNNVIPLNKIKILKIPSVRNTSWCQLNYNILHAKLWFNQKQKCYILTNLIGMNLINKTWLFYISRDMISGMKDSTSRMVSKCLKIQDLPFTLPKLGGE